MDERKGFMQSSVMTLLSQNLRAESHSHGHASEYRRMNMWMSMPIRSLIIVRELDNQPRKSFAFVGRKGKLMVNEAVSS